jgi:acyl carrier protein
MEKVEEFVQKFKNQFIDADSITLTKDSEFRQIDSWDSLTGMAVLVMIKDDYGVDIPVEKFRNQKTVQDVYSLILTLKK